MDDKERQDYLSKLLGSEERAKEALQARTSMKQKELQEAGIEQKGTKSEDTEPEEQPTKHAEKEAPTVDLMKQVVEQVGKEFDIEGLNKAFEQVNYELEKLPVLEDLVKQQVETIEKLQGEKDEELVKMITPPAGRFAWSQKNRASQSDETVVDDEEKEKLQKGQAGIPADDDYWLSQATGAAPVNAE